MNNTFLVIIGVVLLICVITLLNAVKTLNRRMAQMAMCMHEINIEIAQQRYIDKNLEGFKIGSLKYMLIGARLYIKAIMEQAVVDERYEDAQRCKDAINEISKLINY